jgi:3-keto-L-gulonate-6-phosphate decarboxylase
MAYVLNAPDKLRAAKQMEELDVDYIVAHLGYDERRLAFWMIWRGSLTQ